MLFCIIFIHNLCVQVIFGTIVYWKVHDYSNMLVLISFKCYEKEYPVNISFPKLEIRIWQKRLNGIDSSERDIFKKIFFGWV